jgi:hypothetical protein
MSSLRSTDGGTRTWSLDPATWALISGVAGLVANILLILFFALAQPFSETTNGLSWLGPANDGVIVLQFATSIPVAIALRDRLPATRLVQVATAAAIVAMGAAVVLQLLLIVGVLDFDLQAPIISASFLVVFLWILVVSRAGLHFAALPRVVARAGSMLGLGFPVGVLIAACGLLFEWGSTAQYVAFGLAGVLGSVAWLGLPVWLLMLGRLVLNRKPIERGESQ